MTDNEIVKALKSEIHLAEYIDNNYCDNIDISLIQSAINSINRLQAKVIKEQNKNSRLRNERNHLQANNEEKEDVIQYADKEIKRLNAENERLKEEKSKLENKIDEMYPLVMQLPNAMQQAKSEAYKEFAEELKHFIIPQKADGYTREIVLKRDIDNLLKEMAGEE